MTENNLVAFIIIFADTLSLWTSLAAAQTMLRSCLANTSKLQVISFPVHNLCTDKSVKGGFLS